MIEQVVPVVVERCLYGDTICVYMNVYILESDLPGTMKSKIASGIRTPLFYHRWISS